MKYQKLKNGFKLPVIGFGTYAIGGGRKADHSNDKEGIAAIQRAIKMGYTHLDTAESYGKGHCETLVGKAIKPFDRKKLFITTKVTDINQHYDALIKSAKKSLKRLQTDYINLYLLHRPNPKIPIKETMKAMDYLVEQGMVKYIGVSNFSAKQMNAAQQCTKNKIVANQIEYNLIVRNHGRFNDNMEKEIIPYCQKNDIIVTAWGPLGRGLLTQFKYRVLKKLSAKYKKTAAQIAINWLISKKNIVAIPKATSVKYQKENLDATNFKISKKDMKELDEGIV